MAKKLLEGIRVVDFCWHLTGPLTTKHLSDLGAEVIIVESRRRPGWRRGPPRSSSTDQFCTTKLSVTINTLSGGGAGVSQEAGSQGGHSGGELCRWGDQEDGLRV